jgi:hypothetical protein
MPKQSTTLAKEDKHEGITPPIDKSSLLKAKTREMTASASKQIITTGLSSLKVCGESLQTGTSS